MTIEYDTIDDMISELGDLPEVKNAFNEQIKNIEFRSKIDDELYYIESTMVSMLTDTKESINNLYTQEDIEYMVDSFDEILKREIKYARKLINEYKIEYEISRVLVDEILDVDLLTDGSPKSSEVYFDILKSLAIEGYETKLRLLYSEFYMFCSHVEYWPKRGLDD